MIDSTCTASRHGTKWAYQKNRCRCPDAREAARIYQKRLREGRNPSAFIPAAGTVRRLQALAAIGHSFATIGKALGGITGQGVQQIGKTGQVRRVTAARVAALYDQWSMTVGASSITRSRAEARGWAPPLAWDNIDDPDEAPHLVTEQQVARVRALIRRGRSQRSITATVGVPERLVRRIWRETRPAPTNVAV
jgi:hypothetical protein